MNVYKVIKYKYNDEYFTSIQALRDKYLKTVFFIEPISDEILSSHNIERVSEYPALDELKNVCITKLGSAFATRRDKIRFIPLSSGTYGFDCSNEDITNFMSVYTPLLIKGEGSKLYKVWTSETTKELVRLTLEDFSKVHDVVADDQIKAYQWYEIMKTNVNNCQTVDELIALVELPLPTETY